MGRRFEFADPSSHFLLTSRNRGKSTIGNNPWNSNEHNYK